MEVRLEPGEYVLPADMVQELLARRAAAPPQPTGERKDGRGWLTSENEPGCGWTNDVHAEPMVFCEAPAEWELTPSPTAYAPWSGTFRACTLHKERALAEWPDADAVVRRL